MSKNAATPIAARATPTTTAITNDGGSSGGGVGDGVGCGEGEGVGVGASVGAGNCLGACWCMKRGEMICGHNGLCFNYDLERIKNKNVVYSSAPFLKTYTAHPTVSLPLWR